MPKIFLMFTLTLVCMWYQNETTLWICSVNLQVVDEIIKMRSSLVMNKSSAQKQMATSI